MKRNNNTIYALACLMGMTAMLFSCRKFNISEAPMTPIEIGDVAENFESLEENSSLQIPVKFTTPCDSGLASAYFKVVNNRYSPVSLVFSPPVNIPVHDKTIDTTLNIPIRRGTQSVVITIFDKAGKMSSKSIDIKSVSPVDANVKTLSSVVMSTDPADNQNFFSLYESTPVFGSAAAQAKQQRIDFVLLNMGGAKFVSCNAYAANADYFNASKANLAGFKTLTYGFLSSTRPYVNSANMGAIVKEKDLANFLNDTVLAPGPKGANYNIMNADRRVSDAYNETAVDKGFIFGWGYRNLPTANPGIILNESFALFLVRTVTKKANGHYVITFDVKAPATDQRAAYNTALIAPYDPYPL